MANRLKSYGPHPGDPAAETAKDYGPWEDADPAAESTMAWEGPYRERRHRMPSTPKLYGPTSKLAYIDSLAEAQEATDAAD